jgi:hypothetical protein
VVQTVSRTHSFCSTLPSPQPTNPPPHLLPTGRTASYSQNQGGEAEGSRTSSFSGQRNMAPPPPPARTSSNATPPQPPPAPPSSSSSSYSRPGPQVPPPQPPAAAPPPTPPRSSNTTPFASRFAGMFPSIEGVPVPRCDVTTFTTDPVSVELQLIGSFPSHFSSLPPQLNQTSTA